MKTKPIRVVIVDDHAGVRKGLRSLLKTANDIEVVGEASDGAGAIEIVEKLRPQVLVLDVELPVKRGDEVARYITQKDWKVKVLAISSHADKQFVRSMLEAGASEYILKDDAPARLVDALREVVRSKASNRSRSKI